MASYEVCMKYSLKKNRGVGGQEPFLVYVLCMNGLERRDWPEARGYDK